MAMEDTEDTHHSYKELKKMAKKQKKVKKKDKKKTKMEKKIAKKEAKMRKKGMFLNDVSTSEETEVEEVEVFEGTPWVRKSTEGIPYLEKKIDRMAERRESSSLHQMFEEKYGQSLEIPETYREYELTDSEKRRLEEITGKEEVEEPIEVTAVEPEEAAVEVEEPEKKVEKKKKVFTGELKPIYYPFQLWIYTKYGQDKHFILKIIFLIISLLLCILSLPFRLVIWIIMMIVKKIKSRKTKKVAKEKTEATEA